MYEIIKIMPLFVHDNANIFTLIKTMHLLAIDKKKPSLSPAE